MKRKKYPKYLKPDMKFGRLTVIGIDGDSVISNISTPSNWKYLCKCDCGNIRSIWKLSLVKHRSNSCGCLQKEKVAITGNKNSKINTITCIDNYIYIYLENVNCYAIIDKEDYEIVKDYKWHGRKSMYTTYVLTNIKGTRKKLRLHNIILPCNSLYEVDHINHNGLDNRKDNLRIVTRSQNNMNQKTPVNNTSDHTGVSFNNQHKKWEAYITVNRYTYKLGMYLNKCDAVKARKEAEIKYFGEFRYQEPDKETKKIFNLS